MAFLLLFSVILLAFFWSFNTSKINKRREDLTKVHSLILDIENDLKMLEFDLETERIIEKKRIWQAEFDKVAAIYKKAKAMEKENPHESIKLYESIRDTNYGNFGTLERLIVLYNKIGDRKKLIQSLSFLIEETQMKEYERMEFLQQKFPEEAKDIRRHYEFKTPYITPKGVCVNFHSKVDRLQKRLEREMVKLKQ